MSVKPPAERFNQALETRLHPGDDDPDPLPEETRALLDLAGCLAQLDLAPHSRQRYTLRRRFQQQMLCPGAALRVRPAHFFAGALILVAFVCGLARPGLDRRGLADGFSRAAVTSANLAYLPPQPAPTPFDRPGSAASPAFQANVTTPQTPTTSPGANAPHPSDTRRPPGRQP